LNAEIGQNGEKDKEREKHVTHDPVLLEQVGLGALSDEPRDFFHAVGAFLGLDHLPIKVNGKTQADQTGQRGDPKIRRDVVMHKVSFD
jgi:hypothetical protein